MRKLLLIALATLGFSSAAHAVPSGLDQDYLVPYAGVYNVLSEGKHPIQLGLEYRFSDVFYGLRPTLGFNFDTQGDAYGYGGINWEIPLWDNKLLLIPNFMAGLYHEGDGKDLGGAIEFRSGIELAYQMENNHRIGVAFNHISNASIYDKNPGAEAVIVTYSIPVNKLF